MRQRNINFGKMKKVYSFVFGLCLIFISCDTKYPTYTTRDWSIYSIGGNNYLCVPENNKGLKPYIINNNMKTKK